MTLENFNVKKDMVSRYFHRDKWKDEAGVFQYPRGKRRIEAIMESLEIVFDKEEFSVEKELTLRGDNVSGNIFVVSVVMDDKKAYMALTITDHLFALMVLPDNCIDSFSFIAKEEKAQGNISGEESYSLNKLEDKKNTEDEAEKETLARESGKGKTDSTEVLNVDKKAQDESIEEEIERAFRSEMPEFPDLPEI